MLWIVGVGVHPEHLTDEGKKAISNAKKVYGSKRAIEIAREYITGDYIVMSKFSDEEYRKIEKESKKMDVAVLSTGDPMVAGLGRLFRDAKIIPGISSVQIALSRLGVDICDVVIVNAHSSDIAPNIPEHCGKNILVLARKGVKLRYPGRKMIVLERLCSSRESIYEVEDEFTVRDDYTIVFVEVKA